MLYDYVKEDANSSTMKKFLKSLDKGLLSSDFERCFEDLKISKLKDVAKETEKGQNNKC